MNNIDKMNNARLKNQLEKIYNFGKLGIMPLKDFFEINQPLYKKIYIKEYSDKKIHLVYKKLDEPLKKYYIFYTENNCIEVSKMVYDYYNITERI